MRSPIFYTCSSSSTQSQSAVVNTLPLHAPTHPVYSIWSTPPLHQSKSPHKFHPSPILPLFDWDQFPSAGRFQSEVTGSSTCCCPLCYGESPRFTLLFKVLRCFSVTLNIGPWPGTMKSARCKILSRLWNWTLGFSLTSLQRASSSMSASLSKRSPNKNMKSANTWSICEIRLFVAIQQQKAAYL